MKRNKIPVPKFGIIKKVSNGDKILRQNHSRNGKNCFPFKSNDRIISTANKNTNFKNTDKLNGFSTGSHSGSFIDYTFSNTKNMIIGTLKDNENKKNNRAQSKKVRKYEFKNKEKEAKNFLNDLTKTYEINIQMIKTLYQNDSNIPKIINSIQNNLKKKQEIQSKLTKIKGQIVIERQIQSENNRKFAELCELYKEQINQQHDKNNNKDEYITVLIRRIKEIEIFANRKYKQRVPGFEKYKDFKVKDFLSENTLYSHKLMVLKNEQKQIKSDIEELKKNKNNTKFNVQNFCNKDVNNKLHLVYFYYNSLIKKASYKITLLKNFKKNQNRNLKYLNAPDIINKINIDENAPKSSRKTGNFLDASIDLTRSNIAFEDNKKLESFMDLSVILNDNKENVSNLIDTTNGTIFLRNVNFGKITNLKFKK